MAIGNSPDITGIQIGGTEHRLSLFADDVVLFLTDLGRSVQAVGQILKVFGEFSGYNINQKKSSPF